VCRPTESNEDGGMGENTSVVAENPLRVIFCGLAGPDGCDRTDDGGFADEVIWKYQGKQGTVAEADGSGGLWLDVRKLNK